MRLLIVEDEDRLARQLASAFEASGYAVEIAPDGETADFLLETERYDAAILDLGLPKMDGLVVLQRCRSAANAVPILETEGDCRQKQGRAT
jgi:two-component system, OmpR family, response regulator